MNTLYYGDNLDILRRYVDDESVDLVYLDPPFNRRRTTTCFSPSKTGADPPHRFRRLRIRGDGTSRPRMLIRRL